ncbi:MAG: hypothetical protein WDN67_00260 [Candidatus Moraniibacteriota bacterium]
MLGITEIKSGKKILLGDEPYVVLEYQHSKIGRAGAVLRTKLRNLVTGATLEHTFQGADKVEEVEIAKSRAQYLYQEGENFVFMDNASYEQFELNTGALGPASEYLVEGTEVTVLNGRNVH